MGPLSNKEGKNKMITSISSALSGLFGFQKKHDSSANNIANINTDGYKKTRVTLEEGIPNGVTVNIQKVETPGPLVYERTNEGQRLVEKSNVDLTEEITDMMISKQYYEANLKTIQTENIKSIELEVRIDNKKAIDFYEKHGFKIIEKIEKFYQTGEDAYTMRLIV